MSDIMERSREKMTVCKRECVCVGGGGGAYRCTAHCIQCLLRLRYNVLFKGETTF